ncbi:hypothetical protein HN51_058012 [Arachis hypogaea]
MVEIYNEQVRNLLAEDKTDNKLEIRSFNDDGLSLPDATLRPVTSTTDVLALVKLGEVHRAVSSTALNNRSSRSHSVLTMHVHRKDVITALTQKNSQIPYRNSKLTLLLQDSLGYKKIGATLL